MVERKYVDVNVFVYWLSGEGETLNKAISWITRIENSVRGEYCTSSLTLYELIVIVAGLTGRSLADREFVRDVINAIFSLKKLTLIPFSKRIISKAINIMNTLNLDFEDAIHYATAIESNAKKIITNDRDFDKTSLERIF